MEVREGRSLSEKALSRMSTRRCAPPLSQSVSRYEVAMLPLVP